MTIAELVTFSKRWFKKCDKTENPRFAEPPPVAEVLILYLRPMTDVAAVVKDLEQFAPAICELGGPANPHLVLAFEQATGLTLPADYLAVVARANGFSVMGNEVYGLRGPDEPTSLEAVYRREHVEVQVPQPPYLVPFSPDGGGNFYCFDTRYPSTATASCPVVFWVSNYRYSEADPPEVVYPSFLVFVQEVIIAWALEDYDYDGNER
jgi:hypothetical protein